MSHPAPSPAESALERHFGHSTFRPGQQGVVEAVLAGRDTVAIMPTGNGKSICYQLPALMLEGTTLVVSPLIALMKDQVDALAEKGIPATFINSSLDPAEAEYRLSGLASGRYKLVYIAPERFKNRAFMEAIQGITIARLAVDEAHCVSQWGHDFRPDFLRLRDALAKLGRPPVLAATATATPEVREDIVKQLGLNDPAVFVTGFDRPNLRYVVRPASGEAAKLSKVLEIAQKTKGSGIVYASTRKNVEAIAEHLEAAGVSAVAYHAGLHDTEREQAQDAWMAGKARVVVATNAFGMGVDKPNVRFVIHHDLPGTVEAYYQEAGRAGRDQLASYCVLIFSPADRYLQEFFIEGSCPSVSTLSDVYQVLCDQGPDEFVMTHEAIGRAMPGKVNDMAIGTCLNLLERNGVIARAPRGANHAYVRHANDLMPIDSRAKMQKLVYGALKAVLRDELDAGAALDLTQFVSYVGESRESVLSALHGLHERGLIAYTPPQRGRAMRLIKRAEDFHSLKLDVTYLIGKQAREVAKLDAMVNYAHTADCRRAYILDYFGETAPSRCGACDRCLESPGARSLPAPKAPVRVVAKIAPVAKVSAAPGDPVLLSALREARAGIAKDKGLPPYCIAHDRVLDAVAAARPQSLEALAAIKGIGEDKCRQWGAAMLAAIAAHQAPPASLVV
ncbi:MAG TPA: ATP-dependent DNA helicase RecQ [Pantanalinema sp.]